MSTSIASRSDFAARYYNSSSRKTVAPNFLGSTAVVCVVLGCAWTVYANVLGAGVYPTLESSDYDLPAVKRQPAVASATSAIRKIQIARVEPAPQIAAPETIASGPTLSFTERFTADLPQDAAPARVEASAQAAAPKPAAAPKLADAPKPAAAPKLAEAPKPKDAPAAPAPAQVALNVPPPPSHPVETKAKAAVDSVRDMAQRAKAAVLSIASLDKPSIVEKLWGKPQPSQPHGALLSYASADAGSVTGSLGSSQNSATLGAAPPYDRDTAVYDISAHMVYLPDGSKLEAHSGLGAKLDDPRYVSSRMVGPTPPHLYDLTPRESLFHGVAALRLNPIGGEETIYGRSGLLAHTFMLGPNGDSNGCVSFRDYNAFLNAYRNQGIKRLAVVARVE
jgi:hypothetical protein